MKKDPRRGVSGRKKKSRDGGRELRERKIQEEESVGKKNISRDRGRELRESGATEAKKEGSHCHRNPTFLDLVVRLEQLY